MRIAPSVLRFALVGGAATLIHVSLAVGLIEGEDLHPSFANGIAFIVANFFSYVANTRWSFEAKISMYSWYRFVAVSLVSGLMAVIISWLVAAAGGPYMLGILLVVSIIPTLNYIGLRYFTYR